jgi:hypothetical protein
VIKRELQTSAAFFALAVTALHLSTSSGKEEVKSGSKGAIVTHVIIIGGFIFMPANYTLVLAPRSCGGIMMMWPIR